MPSTPNETPAGKARLGLWDAISIIIGIVIGASIFKVPWLIFLHVSDPWMGLLVWVVGGVLAIVGALCYAELATTYPRDGGDYVYLTKAFGSWVGFLFGWGQLAIILPASIGAMAVVFADFAVKFPEMKKIWEDQGLVPELMWAVTAVAAISLLNILGVVFGKTVQNLLTFAKVVGLGAIVVAGFSSISFDNLEPAPLGPSPPWQSLAIILVLYAYGGWNDAAFVAAEVRNPRRNIPLALILGVSAITVIYLLVNAAYLLGLGFAGARQPGNPERLLTAVWGEWGGEDWGKRGGHAISIIIMVSALGAVNGLIFTGSRVYSTLGADHRLFAWLSRTTRLGSPVFALFLQALITLGIVMALGTQQGHEAINQGLISAGLVETAPAWDPERAFDQLVAHTAPVFWVFFLMTGLSLFVLREQNPNLERPFSVPLYPLLPIIFCNMCGYMIYQSVIYVKWPVLYVVAGLLGDRFAAVLLVPRHERERARVLQPGPNRKTDHLRFQEPLFLTRRPHHASIAPLLSSTAGVGCKGLAWRRWPRRKTKNRSANPM